jgi:peptidoglycan/xylan/chitin deacetylase (PgdA/CDA1 family)
MHRFLREIEPSSSEPSMRNGRDKRASHPGDNDDCDPCIDVADIMGASNIDPRKVRRSVNSERPLSRKALSWGESTAISSVWAPGSPPSAPMCRGCSQLNPQRLPICACRAAIDTNHCPIGTVHVRTHALLTATRASSGAISTRIISPETHLSRDVPCQIPPGTEIILADTNIISARTDLTGAVTRIISAGTDIIPPKTHLTAPDTRIIPAAKRRIKPCLHGRFQKLSPGANTEHRAARAARPPVADPLLSTVHRPPSLLFWARMCRSFFVLLAFAISAVAQSKVAYLTFDDGPQRGTSDVLDVLKEEQATATFFLTGSNALNVGGIDAQRALVQRTLAEGHELGNHGYIHKPMTKADYRATYGDLSTEQERAAFATNFQRNEDHFRKTLNQPDFRLTMSRLPGDGSTFPILVGESQKLGMQHYHWDNEFAPIGVFKWLKNENWQGAAGVAADYPELPSNGAVLLMHDRHWAGEKRAALKGLLTVL